ncbi:phosphatase PAP2 family protein [Allonocardiopsis opalescens]|uniref:Undecaprenyl-diphosphatase n=1 Tax=Allonocardiopsis opalescens TaxID=1144618 RepID=A0A2T0PXB5_9ACTN|nr:phosphatase PAP2 family protein [Allonocardiopsis opalescens]PRX96036.1 undecaprenyl-diphosphatase [Allonocardiopsis opalescens]
MTEGSRTDRPTGAAPQAPLPGRPVWAARTCAAALALFALLGLFVADFGWGRPEAVQQADDLWLGAVEAARAPELTGVALFLDAAGAVPYTYLALGGVALLLAVWRRWWALLFFALSYVTAQPLATTLFKALLDRPRPVDRLVPTDSAAYPSGHTVTAAVISFALVMVVLVAMRPRRYAFGLSIGAAVLITAAMAWSRTYLGAHWLSDTVGAVCLGVGLTLLWWWLLAPRIRAELRR